MFYLAGPIEGCNREAMVAWRSHAEAFLLLHSQKVFNPTRRIEFHIQLNDSSYSNSNNICNRIVKQDLADIDKCNIIIADVRRASGKGTGTSMELMYAHTKGKIIILWADEEDILHPFYEYVSTEKHFILNECLEAALNYTY